MSTNTSANNNAPSSNCQTDDNNASDMLTSQKRSSLIRLCKQYATVGGRILSLFQDIQTLLPAAAEKYDTDYDAVIKRCEFSKSDVEDLISMLEVTAAALLVKTYAVGWRILVERGFILNVFSADGLRSIWQRIVDATSTLQEIINIMHHDVGRHELNLLENFDDLGF